LRRTLLVAGALLAMWPTPAFAVGVELAWNACFSKPGAVGLATSACGENLGSQSLFASFVPPAGVDRLEGIEVFIDYQVEGSALPCWWNFAIGQLRRDQLTLLHVSPTDVNGDPLIECDNHYFLDNGALGGGGMIVTGANRGQLKGLAAIPAGTGLPVAAEAQQYGIGFRISNGSTTPPGTCDGCAADVCFVLNTINLTSSGVPNVVMQSPHTGSDNFVLWQTTAWEICFTPVRQNTWGEIKSLYR
jgi:hypothetical protein